MGSLRLRRPMSLMLVLVLSFPLMFGVPKQTEVYAASDAVINLAAERQLIKGFGGMNHPAWIGDLTPAQRDTAFGNGPGQLGFSIVRIFVDENSANWHREVAT